MKFYSLTGETKQRLKDRFKEHRRIIGTIIYDEPNRALWLATRAGKMELSCRSRSRKKHFPESHVINPLLTTLVRSRLLDIGLKLILVFASFWTSTSSRSINTQKNYLVNIQPSWPCTRSITHLIYLYTVHVWWPAW